MLTWLSAGWQILHSTLVSEINPFSFSSGLTSYTLIVYVSEITKIIENYSTKNTKQLTFIFTATQTFFH